MNQQSIKTRSKVAGRRRERICCQVRMNTPAFLGNAEQSGQWRTSPFKALLRQWWRIAQSGEHGYDPASLREAEGRLFGHAWLKPGGPTDTSDKRWASRSQVRMRLRNWEEGRLSAWHQDNQFQRIATTRDGKSSVRADLYAGFGPILPPSKKEGRKFVAFKQPAIDLDQTNVLALDLPSAAGDEIKSVLQLIHWFGAVGSRSRNGWGSLGLASAELALGDYPSNTELEPYCQPLENCLTRDWPGAIGSDDAGALVWYSTDALDWHDTINEIARLKVAIRSLAKEFRGPSTIGGIHLLGYPAGGNWKLPQWGNDTRMACPLRFKVGADKKGYWITICHTPYQVPDPLFNQLESDQKAYLRDNAIKIWQRIHQFLDNEASNETHELQRAVD